MKTICQQTLFLTILLTASVVQAQVDTLARYSPGFPFNDGIYSSRMDFLENCPSLVASELYTEEGLPVSEIGMSYPIYTMRGDTMFIVESDSVWGYCNEGQVFLRHQDFYNRLVIIGGISHILHNDDVVNYDYNYTSYYTYNNQPVVRDHNAEYLIDMRTGVMEYFTLDAFSSMLETDPKLYTEFTAIKSRAKRKSRVYLYMRKFNDAHPLYFPLNGCDTDSMGKLLE